MKTKSILSSLILLVFVILGGGSFDENGHLSGWVWVVGIIFVVIFIIAAISGSQEEAKKKAREEQLRLEREEKLKIQTEEYNALKQQFLATNGVPDKSLVISDLDLNSEIHVYESSKKVFILGKEYSFKDVISCTFSDNPRIVKGKITAVTKSKNGNVIGRAIVGDVVAGPAGAIIGGTTAKKNTEYIQEDDKTIHDYTVIINMNSIAEPIIRIHTGEDGKLTNEIVGLMRVIISRK
jgi:uncharacterized membrane protein